MEGFTPTFFLQLVISVLSGGIAYGVLKTDLKNTIAGLQKETQLREDHEKDDDETHHDIRDKLGEVVSRVSILEGRSQR
jgi:hypothetical protein